MATKTEPLPTLEQATADLEKAKAKHAQTRAAVIAGDAKVTPRHVAAAQDEVDFAELRVELATNSDADRTEKARQDRIAELVAHLTTGETAAKGRNVVELEAKAVAALEALHFAARDYRDDVRAAANELGRIGDLPDGVEVRNLNYQPGKTVIDGVLIEGSYNFGDWPGNVLLGAIYRALHPHLATLSDKSTPLYDLAAKAVAGGLGTPKITPAEQLADQLAKTATQADQ